MNIRNLTACALTMLINTNVHALSNNGLYPLPTFENNWTAIDLAPLDKIIGNAEYVGLGENVHATEGFSQAKFRLIKYLVEEKNFRAIAMETPWVNSRITANYIATCQGTAKEALAGIFPVWWSQSVVDLFSWLCEFNQNHPNNPIKFYGFDTQNSSPDIFSDLQNRLSQLVPQQSNQLINGISACFGFGLDTAAYYQAASKINSGSDNITDKNNNLCMQGLDNIDKTLQTLDPKDLNTQWAGIDSVGLRSTQGEFYYLNRNHDTSLVSRDTGMAHEIIALHNIFSPDSKTIIWAHNVHLALNHSEVTVSPYTDSSTNTMGYYLKQSLHSDYAVLALTGYKVQFHWPGQNIDELPAPSSQSVEALLHGTPFLNSILDLNEDFLTVGQRYDLGMESMTPRQQYNGILYLDTCLPMESPKGNLPQEPKMMLLRKRI
jgi:erythromycin esterase